MDQASSRPTSLAAKTRPGAVGRESDLLRAAERLVGRVGVHGRHEVLGFAAAVHRHEEEVGPAAVAPGVPMADEELVVEASGGLPLFDGLELGRRRLGGQAGEDVHREGQLGLGQDQVADVERQAGPLLGLAAVDLDAPDLRRARTRREEEDPLAAGGPAAVEVGGGMTRQAVQALPVGADEPDIRAAAVGGQVRLADGEGDPLAVRRDLAIGDPVHGQHVVDGQGMGRGRGLGRRESRAEGQERQRKKDDRDATHGSPLQEDRGSGPRRGPQALHIAHRSRGRQTAGRGTGGRYFTPTTLTGPRRPEGSRGESAL